MRIDMPTCQYGEEHCKKHFDGNCLLKQDLLDERCPIRRTINDVLEIVDEESKEYFEHRDCGEQTLFAIKKRVLALKGGER